MWNPFKKKEVVPEHSNYVLTSTATLKPKERGWLREGMWVVSDGRVGILYKLLESSAEVHYTAATGETILTQLESLNSLRQAKYSEIPEGRRASFDREVARSKGYGD
jgi:hypothetical protein